MGETTARLLLVDDDAELAGLMGEFFTAQSYLFRAVHNGPQGLAEALTGAYDLVLLDVMLPGMDGFEILRRLREKSQVPVLMLTGQGDARRRIQGLEGGADDYLPKPFEPRELLARVRAVLRRAQPTPAAEEAAGPVEAGGVLLDTQERTVQCEGKPVEVTSAEFEILEMLLREAGKVVSRDQLSQKLYGRDASPFDRSIDVHMSHLRRKLEKAGDCIRTVRGVGYQFAVKSAERS